MRVVRRAALALAAVTAGFVLLSLLARFSDGPIGPFAGGPLSGTVDPNPRPDWSTVGDTVEMQINPEAPWSLQTYALPLNGELYVPSFYGPRRRWPAVALKDPRVRVRLGGKLYERRIVRIDDPALRRELASVMARRHGYAADGIPARDDTWYFHIAAAE